MSVVGASSSERSVVNTIIDKGKEWEIKCHPHVAIRIKRLFTSARASQGKIILSKSPDNAFDLKWFMQRYEFDGDITSLDDLVTTYEARQQKIKDVLSGKIKPRKIDLALPPREYQRLAADLALETGRLLVADELGLGKTITAISSLAGGAKLPALVVTLTHLTHQWQSEFAKFAPQYRTHILKKGTPYDLTKERKKKVPEPDIIICNYHKLAGWSDTLAGKVGSIVFDECQELRRSTSQKYAAAKHIADYCSLRVGCSATPIYGYGDEFYNVFSVLDEGSLGSRSEFLGEWCSAMDYQGRSKIHDPASFGSWLRQEGLMLRRTRADVARELEPLTKIPVEISADTKALDKIKGAARDLADIVLSKAETARGAKMRAAEELNNMVRQATGTAKAPHVADFVRNVVESGESVVLFGWHHAVYDIWRQKLKDLNPVFYTGSESSSAKLKAEQAFKNGDSKILIMSLRAGAGLDGLQDVCRVAVFGELDWAPGVIDQCAGRLHRDGQQDPVLAYFLLSDYGTDPVMMDVLGVKRGQINPVLNNEASVVSKQQEESNAVRLAKDILSS